MGWLAGRDRSARDGPEEPQSVLQHVLDRCCRELEIRLRRGESVGAEEYLARHPLVASDTEAAVELIYQEYLTREDLGFRPSVEEYLARFASWRERLARQFAFHTMLSDLPASDEGDGEDSTSEQLSGFYNALEPATEPYRILREVARGNNVLYEALQPGTNRRVALKCIDDGGWAAPDSRKQLLAEARMAAMLRHPNIVQVVDVGVQDNRPFLAMEFIEGQSLARWLRDAQPTPQRAARLVEILAGALHYAHMQGVIHRDLSPANIMLTTEGSPIITDFGLALPASRAARRKSLGVIVGTPGYMAPEQAGGAASVTAAADIHALGAILYELLTGHPPFPTEPTLEAMQRLLRDPAVPPRRFRREIPAALEQICLKCLEKDPRNRYQTADALADDLSRFVTHEPAPGRWTAGLRRPLRLFRQGSRPGVPELLTLLLGAGVLALLAWQIHGLQAGLAGLQAKLDAAPPVPRQLALSEERTREAQQQGRRHLYALHLRRVRQAMTLHDRRLATDLLDGLRPRENEPDLRGFEWYALAHRVNHPVAILPAVHRAAVYTAAVAPDGRHFITGDLSGTLVRWDSQTLQPIKVLPAHESTVTHLQYTPDGLRLLSACGDTRGRRQVALWDAETLQALGEPVPLQADLQYLGVAPDGRTVALREYEPVDRARLWRITADGLRARRDDDLDARHLAVSPDGRHLAAVLRDGTLSIQPIDPGAARDVWTQKIETRVEAIAWRPDGNGLVLTTHQATLLGITPRQGVAWTATRDDGRVAYQVQFSPDGATLIAVDNHGLSVYDATTGHLQRDCVLPRGHTRQWCAVSPDGVSAFIGDTSTRARHWDLRTGKSSAVPELNDTVPRTASWFSTSRCVVFGAEDGRPRFWRQEEPPALETSAHEGEAWCVAFAPSGTRAASGGDDNAVRLWKLDRERFVPDRILKAHESTVSSLAFTPDGEKLVTGDLGGGLIVWDLVRGERLTTLNEPHDGAQIRSLRIAPDGRRLATAWSDGTMRTWDLDSLAPVTRLSAHYGKTRALAFSPDGRSLATVGNDAMIRLWNLDDPQPDPIWERPLASQGVGVAFAPDGATVAVGLQSGPIELRETRNGRTRATLLGHRHEVPTLVFTSDGETLISGSADGTIRAWDPQTGQERLLLRRYESGLHEVALSPDGLLLASCDHDGAVRLMAAPRDPAARAPALPAPAAFPEIDGTSGARPAARLSRP